MESPFVYKLNIKIWKTGADQVIFQHSDIKVHLFWFSSLSYRCNKEINQEIIFPLLTSSVVCDVSS